MDRRSESHRTQRYPEHRSDGKSGTSRSIKVSGRIQKLIMINRCLEEFPIAWIQVDTPVFFSCFFCGEMKALCLPNPIYDLVIGNIPGVHPDILGNSGIDTAKEMYQEKVIPYIEASECVVIPFNSAGIVYFKVKANTCMESVVRHPMISVERKLEGNYRSEK